MATPIDLTSDRPAAFDAFPAVAGGNDGSAWITWVRYEEGAESICCARVDRDSHGGEPPEVETVSGDSTVNAPPRIALRSGLPTVTWTCYADGRRQVCLAERGEATWTPPRVISGEGTAWDPAAAVDGNGSLRVAWAGVDDGAIHLWSESGHTERVSGEGWARRPQIAPCPEGLVLVWDAWVEPDDSDAGAYVIQSCVLSLDGENAPIQTLSTGEEWALCPEVAVAGDGTVFCSWLAPQDVRDARGVIDQRHLVRTAGLVEGQWRPIGDDGHGTVGELCHGVLPLGQIWGYLGRRLAPLLRTDPAGRVWVLWERRVDPEGNRQPGELIGRVFDGERWGSAVRVTPDGYPYCYYAPANVATDSGPFWIAMRHPQEPEAWNLLADRLALPDPTDEVATEPYPWPPISLPADIAPLPSVEPTTIDGEACRLYFGDLHAHTTLSADAEGEPDMLFRYARQKARLDFVALVDNDFCYCPLMNWEFETGITLADHFDDPGRFVALRGYEWTLWDKEHCDHPNHRTVLFPDDYACFRHIDPVTPTNEHLAEEVARLGGILLTQHQDWDLTNGEAETAFEVCSAWAYYIDKPRPFHRDLVAGRRVGFIGGSDSHRRNPGTCGALTGLYAPTLTRHAIIDAIRSRRAYATSGSPMVLDVRINGEAMGGEVSVNGPPKLRVTVQGTQPLEMITIVRGAVGGRIEDVGPVCELPVEGMSATVEWTDAEVCAGTVFYYVIAKQRGRDIHYASNISIGEGCRAWSSPIWVTQREE